MSVSLLIDHINKSIQRWYEVKHSEEWLYAFSAQDDYLPTTELAIDNSIIQCLYTILKYLSPYKNTEAQVIPQSVIHDLEHFNQLIKSSHEIIESFIQLKTTLKQEPHHTDLRARNFSICKESIQHTITKTLFVIEQLSIAEIKGTLFGHIRKLMTIGINTDSLVVIDLESATDAVSEIANPLESASVASDAPETCTTSPVKQTNPCDCSCSCSCSCFKHVFSLLFSSRKIKLAEQNSEASSVYPSPAS